MIHCASDWRGCRVRQLWSARPRAPRAARSETSPDPAPSCGRSSRPEPPRARSARQPSGVGELLARRVVETRQRVEEARPMADGDHHRERTAVEQVQHAPGERLGARCVVGGIGQRLPPSRTLVFSTVLTCATADSRTPTVRSSATRAGTSLDEAGRTGEERRIVSVLFVDLVGFTSRAESLDPEDVRAVLTPYYEQVRTRAARASAGRVEKFIGDAVMGDLRRAHRAAETTRTSRACRASPFDDWAEADGSAAPNRGQHG